MWGVWMGVWGEGHHDFGVSEGNAPLFMHSPFVRCQDITAASFRTPPPPLTPFTPPPPFPPRGFMVFEHHNLALPSPLPSPTLSHSLLSPPHSSLPQGNHGV